SWSESSTVTFMAWSFQSRTLEHHGTGSPCAAAEGISRTEFILRSCQERARDVLLDRKPFSLTPEQTTALLADLGDSGAAAQDQASIERLLDLPQPWHAPA
ncbi:MAG: DUF1778 domain-containing protein, partial [Cyanobacteriota bacterium]